MKIVNFGTSYIVYGDDLRTYDQLPAATYKVAFSPMSGFSLEQISDFQQTEEKIYGNHLSKIDKALRSFKKFDRSMGIILSGNKGMGKSMFVQLLSEEVVKLGLPVIMVKKPHPGIAEFLDSIDQECLIIFDEFEKVFNMRKEEGGGESQDSLLGLFDGTSQKKRMYAITVNELNKVSEFMLSRPGRFHYHIRFDYPMPDEVEIYLKDKVEAQFHDEIRHVISFSHRVKLNYDSLRAIAFELNEGRTFKSSIADLNILATDLQRYDFEIKLSNGVSKFIRGQRTNIFREQNNVNTWTEEDDYINVEFDSSAIQAESAFMKIPGTDLNVTFGEENTVYKKDGEIRVEELVITHHREAGANYRLDF